jgi:phosphatidylinositol kinase/protein kinase (PI-3  family)
MTFVETLRSSKDPLATLSLYEQRLSRRFLQTLNKLHQMQKERKALEQEQLKQLYMMSLHHPEPETLEPSEFGFVCSSAEWKMFYKRIQLLTPPPKSPNGNTGYKNRSQSGRQLTRRAA